VGYLDNARYWYGRAHRTFPGPDAVDREITAANEAARNASGPGG
jgi:hypothetical protein